MLKIKGDTQMSLPDLLLSTFPFLYLDEDTNHPFPYNHGILTNGAAEVAGSNPCALQTES